MTADIASRICHSGGSTVCCERRPPVTSESPVENEPRENPRPDRITLRFMVSPGDIAASGISVAAGRVLEWIDKAGYACAVGWSRAYCVTAYVGNVHFTYPVAPG